MRVASNQSASWEVTAAELTAPPAESGPAIDLSGGGPATLTAAKAIADDIRAANAADNRSVGYSSSLSVSGNVAGVTSEGVDVLARYFRSKGFTVQAHIAAPVSSNQFTL